MGWYKVADGRVVYTGRITRDSYLRWTTTKLGSATVAQTAQTLGFRLFGRTRAARKQLWRDIEAAARSEEGRAALQDAAEIYTRGVGAIAYAQGLPRVTVGLRRLVLVPRALAAARTRGELRTRLSACPGFAARPPALQDFLFESALVEIDAAARFARPSVQRPIVGSKDWCLIGADTGFQWVDQLWSGAAWVGHWFVYEPPRAPLSRSERKDVEKAMASLRTSISTLPRERRHALVKLAAS